jgi:Domain of unknown function (DUF1918)
MHAEVGDRLVIDGDAARVGLIIDVPHADGSPPYVVKWLTTGHIALVSPDQFGRVLHARQAPRRRASRPAAEASDSKGSAPPTAPGAPSFFAASQSCTSG